MNSENLIVCLTEQYKKSFNKKKIARVCNIPLLVKLSGNQLEQLQNGKGNPIAELYQINSSAGLAVNYFKLFEMTHKGVIVEFEWQKSVPLLHSRTPANIDVKYEYDNTIFYIESKFLEPYYSKAKKNLKSYLDKENYPFLKNKDSWRELIRHGEVFNYFDYPQLCRHLLAIYRHYNENPSLYEGKQIVLQSLSWKMTKTFEKQYNTLGYNVKNFQDRFEKIENEKEDANQWFNEHIQNIKWENCRFEIKNYNDDDILLAIEKSSKFDFFKKQYFLENE